MLTKTLKYKNFKGELVESTHHFNITYAELLELEMSVSGGFAAQLQALAEVQDAVALYPVMKQFITMAWGVRSPDGEYFEKDPALLKRFESSAAYDALMRELTMSGEAFFTFIWAIVPQDMAEEAKSEAAELQKKLLDPEPTRVIAGTDIPAPPQHFYPPTEVQQRLLQNPQQEGA